MTNETPPEASIVSEEGLPALPSTCPQAIVKAIEKAMQPRRADRPQSIDEFLALLEGEVVVGPKKKDDEETELKTKSSVNKRGLKFVNYVMLVACVIIGIWVFYKFSNNDEIVISPEKAEAMKKYEAWQNRLFAFTDTLTGLVGCVNNNGDTIIAALYEEINPFSENYVLALKGAKLGMLDKNGNTIIPFEYDGNSGVWEDEKICFLKKNGKFGLLNFQGEILLPFKYDKIVNGGKSGVIGVQIGEKFGLINYRKHKEVLPCEYENVKLGYVRRWSWGGYEYNDLTNHLIAVKNEGRWGFVDLNGKLVVPFKYEDGEQEDNIFYRNAAAVIKNKRYGLIDTLGNVIAPFEYEYIVNMYHKPFFVAKNYKTKKSVLLADDGRIITNAYDWIAHYTLPSEDSVCSFQDGKFEGLLNFYTGEEIIPANKYSSIDQRHNGGYECDKGIYRACKNKKYGFIDSEGKEIIECQYEDALAFTNGFGQVKQNGKWGYVAASSNGIAIGCIYEDCGPFEEDNLARVQYEGKWGCVNAVGKIVIPCKYRSIEKVDTDGLRKVWGEFSETDIYGSSGVLYGYVDNKGNEVIPCKYNDTQVEQERELLRIKMLKEKIEGDIQ